MALPKPPDPLTAFAKTMFGNGATPLWPWINLYDYWHDMSAQGGKTWRRFQFKCEDVGGAGLNADAAWFTIDLVNYTGGIVDDTWNDGDYTAATNQLATICTAWQPFMDPQKHFSELRAYVMQFNENYDPSIADSKPFVESGPPEHVTPINYAGTALPSQMMPQQVAFSVTKLVPHRKHWGRFYLPFPSQDIMSGDFNVNQATCDAIAAAVHQAFANLAASQLFPVVAQTQVNHANGQALLQITGVQVDSNPDVIRRRRRYTTTYRKTLDVTNLTE